MSLQETQPPVDAIRATTSHGAMQHHEKGEVDPTSQQQPRQNQSVPEAAKDRTTQTSAAALSAQGPIVSGKPWAIQRFWAEHVSVVVDFETCRDHLGTYVTCASNSFPSFCLLVKFHVKWKDIPPSLGGQGRPEHISAHSPHVPHHVPHHVPGSRKRGVRVLLRGVAARQGPSASIRNTDPAAPGWHPSRLRVSFRMNLL